MFQSPCKCENSVYVRETYRIIETRKREEAKVCLTKSDIEDGNIESVKVRIGKGDGELAKYSTQFSQGIGRKNSKVIRTKKFGNRESLESASNLKSLS